MKFLPKSSSPIIVLLFSLLTASTLLCSCKPEKESQTSSSDKSSEESGFFPTEANPELRKVKLWIGAKEIEAEVAITPLQIATGVMFRESLETDKGMIFVFPQPREVAFYNKNVKIPLSIAYIGSDGKILELHDLKPYDDNSIFSKEPNIQFVLEMNQGWFEKNGIGQGALVTTDRGSLVLQLPRGSYFR